MAEFCDWRGTPVRVGSRIVYPVRHSRNMWMVEGEVLEVLPHGPAEFRVQLAETHPDWAAKYYQPWKRFNLVVRRLRSSRGHVRQPGRRVRLTMTLWVTVVDQGSPAATG
jgi:hypothetical protein